MPSKKKQKTKSLLQHHSSKASILRHSAFFIVQLSHPYMTTGKTIFLTIWIFVGLTSYHQKFSSFIYMYIYIQTHIYFKSISFVFNFSQYSLTFPL